MNLQLEKFTNQTQIWPAEGQYILAQFDATSIVVYQAFRQAIGRFAAEHGNFGGEFSFARMSWVKPNFLWMMYRSGWGSKPDQETTLAVRIRRDGFDAMLREAVHSTHIASVYPTPESWKEMVSASSVRLQWDPDHDPKRRPLKRRALQLGLRGPTLARYAREWIVSIEDISPFVGEQARVLSSDGVDALLTPLERVYPVSDESVAKKLFAR